MVTENLVNQAYIDEHTVGYDQLTERVQDYPPDRVAGITG
jgi:anaerobic selenocysteine-containing dehydrogenase